MLEENLELFESYLSASFSEQEKLNFEQRLNSESTLKADFEAYKKTTEMLHQKFNDTDRHLFKEVLSQQSDAYFKPKETTKKLFSLYKYVAVAVVLISVIGFYITNSGNPVYSDYATIGTISLTQRSNTNELVKKAEDTFNSGSFDEAIIYFNQLIEQDPSNQEYQLYAGIAQIENNTYTEALTNLSRVSEGNSVYKYEAQWYIALAYLKQEQYDQAKIALQKIPKNATEYSKAKKLLDKF